jgi:hypothetical protein
VVHGGRIAADTVSGSPLRGIWRGDPCGDFLARSELGGLGVTILWRKLTRA